MKKVWIAVLAFGLFAAGCSSNNGEETNNAGASVEASADAEAEAGGDEVSVVFPASVNSNGDVEGMTAEIKEAGATDIKQNDDGSVTATITQENLDKLLEKYHSELTTMIDGVKSGGTEGSQSSIKDLAYDEGTFQEYDLTVDKAAYESPESMDGLVIFGLAMQSMMYQVYSGVEEADISVTFNLIDESTGEVFDTTVLPETPAQ